MGTEIKRKFLLVKMPEEGYIRSYNIEQQYLAVGDEDVIISRIMYTGYNSYSMTIENNSGLKRSEIEMPIHSSTYYQILENSKGEPINKDRFTHRINNVLYEIDVYTGNLTGLRTVEIEFDTVQEAEKFTLPSWMGVEVTYDKRYKNQSLHQNGGIL